MAAQQAGTPLKRLALARQLYLFAVDQGQRPASLRRRIVAVIAYDLAAETALRLIITTLDPAKADLDAPHPKLLQHAHDLLLKRGEPGLPQRADLVRLHHVRNDAQHNARYPSDEEVADCRSYATSFLREASRLVWDIDFDTISLAALVEDDEARGLLLDAEAALTSGHNDLASSLSNAGLSWILSKAAERLFPRSKARLYKGMGLVKWNIGPSQPAKPRIDQATAKELERVEKEHAEDVREIEHELRGLREQVKNELDAIEEPLLCSLLGIAYSDYLRFREIAGRVRFGAGPRDYQIREAANGLSKDQALFVLAFCTEAAIQAESMSGSAGASQQQAT